MFPVTSSDLDGLIAEAERQAAEVESMFSALDRGALTWRADETRWSVTGHVAHLCIINGDYLERISETIRGARAGKGPVSDGPYRHPWFGRWFAGLMEPPPKRRMATMRAMVPDPGADSATERARFAEVQARMTTLMMDARGLDLGKVRFSSPYMALLRFSLGSGFAMLLAHNRRHVWLIEEVRNTPGFPAT
jgi:hypothetical protein